MRRTMDYYKLVPLFIKSGLEIHEEPRFSPRAEETILENVDNDEYVDVTESLDYDDNENDAVDLSQPIGKYVDDGTEPLVQGKYAGLNVFAVIRDDKAELVINGFVCDELDVYDETEFILRTFVNDIEFTFDYKETESGTIMYLYADDELLDSLGLN